MPRVYYSYSDIADEIRRQITSGELPPGAALPTGRVLCERYSVSRQTIASAMLVLRTEGLIAGQQGKAVYVSADHRIVQTARDAETT
ncbi:hypothetical protein Afe04nite_20830 [Asanoa ferruginea]|uniref:winged helix-turn-helix domain-containing protein n=1 Tax=Asanoa ferruginea TaxID=53367 RepID=UPI000E268DE3|nr:winged helix-turn-helix domain-containing protein [Asanoa ferruginea]GIF47544.1 hypothetical protein Afe04nite_20830 [Asanoa ferruginea]